MLKINSLGKREKILVIVTAALLLLFMFKLLIFNPLLDKLSAVKLQIERSQLGIRKYLELAQQKDKIMQAKKQIERYLNLTGSHEQKISLILGKIEAEARNAGLSILDMNPQDMPKTSALPAVYRVQLRGEADIHAFFNFIYNLENADILFKVDKISLSAKDETTGFLKIDVNIIAVSFS